MDVGRAGESMVWWTGERGGWLVYRWVDMTMTGYWVGGWMGWWVVSWLIRVQVSCQADGSVVGPW